LSATDQRARVIDLIVATSLVPSSGWQRKPLTGRYAEKPVRLWLRRVIVANSLTRP